MAEWKYMGIDRKYEQILVMEKDEKGKRLLHLDAECLAELFMLTRHSTITKEQGYEAD